MLPLFPQNNPRAVILTMKHLIAILLLCIALPVFGAVPDYKAFRGTGGITIVSNPPTGTIVIDGSGIAGAPGGANRSIQWNTNGAFGGNNNFQYDPISFFSEFVGPTVSINNGANTNFMDPLGFGSLSPTAFYLYSSNATIRWVLTADGHFVPASLSNRYDVGSFLLSVRTNWVNDLFVKANIQTLGVIYGDGSGLTNITATSTNAQLPFTPPITNNVLFNFNPYSGFTMSNSTDIASWLDASGNGYNAIATNGVFKLLGSGNERSIYGDAAMLGIPTNCVWNTTNFTVMIVCDLASYMVRSYGGIFSGNGNLTGFHTFGGAHGQIGFYNTPQGNSVTPFFVEAGRQTIMMVSSARGVWIRHDHSVYYSPTPFTGGSVLGGNIFGWNGVGGSGRIRTCIGWNTALSDEQCREVERWTDDGFGMTPKTGIVMTPGDSIAASSLTSNGVGRAELLAENRHLRVFNCGENSTTMNQWQSTVFYDTNAFSTNYQYNIVMPNFGVNDFIAGSTSNQVIQYFTNYCAQRRAIGFKIIGSTVLPASMTSGANSNRLGFNGWLSANWTSYCDAFSDPCQDPVIGSSMTNTLYSPDNIHPNTLGHEQLLQWYVPQLNTMIRAASSLLPITLLVNKVGIGNVNPREILDVNGAILVRTSTVSAATAQSVGMLDFATTGERLLSFGADAITRGTFSFYQAGQGNAIGQTPMSIAADGSVGINYGLTVLGTIIDLGSSAPNVLRVGNNGSYASLQSYVSGSPGNIALNASGGTVGIGTTIPSSSLDVTGQVRAASAIVTNTLDASGATVQAATLKVSLSAGINTLYVTNMPGSGDLLAADADGKLLRTNITSVSALTNKVDNLNGLATNLNIKAAAGASLALTVNTNALVVTNGNVGIGTTAPAVPLGVNGAIRSDRTNATSQYIEMNGGDTTGPIITANGSAKSFRIKNATTGGMLLETAGTASAVMLVDNGNVGIGATPVNKLDVEGAVAIGATYSGTSTAPANGLIVEGSTGIGTASPRDKLEVAGGIIISNTGSGLKIGPGNATLTNTLYASATLDFPSTAAGTVSDLPITVAGAVDGDIVTLGPPTGSIGPLTGLYNAWSSNGVVYVRYANNNLVTAQDPASGTFKVRVDKFQ